MGSARKHLVTILVAFVTASVAAGGTAIAIIANADKVDGYHANQLTRVAGSIRALNTRHRETFSRGLGMATAPRKGAFLLTVSFSCVSVTGGATPSRWDVAIGLDGADLGSILVLSPEHDTSEGGANGTINLFVPVNAGDHRFIASGSRTSGDSALDCFIYTTSLFSPFDNAGGVPYRLPRQPEGAGPIR